MLWLDKYAPRDLHELTCHKNVTIILKRLLSSHDIPHILFYGPSGSGKKTRILAMLRYIFGNSVNQLKIETYHDKDSATEIVYTQSPHHIQVSCGDMGSKDRVIVQSLLKEMSSSPSTSSFFSSKGPKFRVFLFQDADSLTDAAQAGLRRTLEKHVKNVRAMMHVEHLSRIMPPLRSRCLCIRLPLPSKEEIRDVLRRICDMENISPAVATDDFLEKISTNSARNLRRSILLLENCAMQNFTADIVKFKLPWEIQVSAMTEIIVQNHSPKGIQECRSMTYDLLSSCISGHKIIMALCRELCNHQRVSMGLRPIIVIFAAYFSHTMKKGTREIWHIEAFIAQVMAQMKAIERRLH